MYPQSSPCDAPAPCNPGKFHGSLELELPPSSDTETTDGYVCKTDGVDDDDWSCCSLFQPLNPLKRSRNSLMMECPENAVIHPFGWGRGTPTHIRGGHVLSSGGDCTALHGGTWTMPHSHLRNKAHQAVMFLAGFRTGIRVSQMDCHGKGVHGAGFRGRIAGPEASWSPPLNCVCVRERERAIPQYACVASTIQQHDDLASSVRPCSIWPAPSLGVSRSLSATADRPPSICRGLVTSQVPADRRPTLPTIDPRLRFSTTAGVTEPPGNAFHTKQAGSC